MTGQNDRIIGPYRLLGHLGTGGGGQVHRAIHTVNGGEVALKLLPPGGKSRHLVRFQREVRALMAIRSPHVVPLIEADLDSPTPWIAMALVAGERLTSHLEIHEKTNGRWPMPGVEGITLGLARALAEIHRAGTLHRDIKPDNLMIDSRGHLVLVDFGLAVREQNESIELTAEGDMIGTFRYLSPEQLYGERKMTAAVDVFQWGLIAHLLLVGHLPYPEMDPVAGVNHRSERGVPPLPVTLPAMERLVRTVEQCLRADPAARPRDGLQLLSLLDAAESAATLPGEPAPSRAPQTGGATAVAGASAASAAGPEVVAREWTLPEKVGEYGIVRVLGEGGMGTVLEGRDTRRGERVAIKLMRAGLTEEKGHHRRFRREIKIMMGVMSPHIVRILDHGKHLDQDYIVMEYLPGNDLGAVLRDKGPFELEKALDLTQQLASGIAELHDRDIIHRDLKPQNLRLTDTGQLKILDLGLAQDMSKTQLTQTGDRLGTPMYGAPEMFTTGESSPATDVFHMGIVFYQLLTARTDFRSETRVDTLRGFLYRDPRLVKPGGAEVGERLLDLFRKAIAPDPRQRIPDGRAFLDEVVGIRTQLAKVGGGPAPAATAAARTRRTTSRTAAAQAPPTGPAASPPVPRSALSTVARGLSIFLQLGIVIFGAWVIWLLPQVTRRWNP